MSEIIIKQQDLNKAKRAVALSSMIHDLSILRKFVEELKTERKTANLANLLEKYKTMDYLEVCRGTVRALEQISKDDLDNIVFLGSSYDLESLVDGNQSSKLKFLKEHWNYESSAHVAMFYNPKIKVLYPAYTGIFDRDYKKYVDVALCGKQDLEQNISISDIPRAKYSDEVFEKIYGDDMDKNKGIDNITPDNFWYYDAEDYLIRRCGPGPYYLYSKDGQNYDQDLKLLLSFFESKAISKAAVDSYMLEKLLFEILNLQPDKINKKERICFSFGGNTGLICDLFDAKKNGVDKCKSECVTVNGLELSPPTKDYFKNELGEDEFNKQQSKILKIRGTLDPVSVIETGVSANTIFFETDNNMRNLHGAYSIMTDKPPTKFMSYRSVFLSYLSVGIKNYVYKNQKNNMAYNDVHSFFEGQLSLRVLFVFFRAGFVACVKTAVYCVKHLFLYVFLRKKYKKEIKIIDTPEKEKSKDEDHNKENEITKEDLKIPKMENSSHEKKDRNDKAI